MGDISAIVVAVKDKLESLAYPTKVYFTNIPQDAAPPYIRWEVVNSMEDSDVRVYTSPDQGEEIWINVNVWAPTMTQAMFLHDGLKTGLTAANIQPTGWKPMRRPRRETSQPLDDVESGLFRMWSRWSLRFCKP